MPLDTRTTFIDILIQGLTSIAAHVYKLHLKISLNSSIIKIAIPVDVIDLRMLLENVLVDHVEQRDLDLAPSELVAEFVDDRTRRHRRWLDQFKDSLQIVLQGPGDNRVRGTATFEIVISNSGGPEGALTKEYGIRPKDKSFPGAVSYNSALRKPKNSPLIKIYEHIVNDLSKFGRQNANRYL